MQGFAQLTTKKVFSLLQKLAIGIIIASLLIKPVSAQSVLKRAELYKVRNQVDLSRQNQPSWNPAQQGEAIVPQDAVRTGANSRAELLFNEGTLVRTGAGTIFRFPPGKRNFELDSGAALMMIRPGQGQSIITTPEAKVQSQGTALFLQHDPNRNASLIGVLTNSPAGLVQVSNTNGDITIQLQAGQFVSIINGVVGLVEYFILPMFYESVELAVGLGTGQEQLIAQESPEVQTTINAVRAEALGSLQNQLSWLNGFCQIEVQPQQLSPLLQWFGLSVPGEQIALKFPETDLFVTPVRSLTGIAWLGNYCQNYRKSQSSK
ncbi:FecR family protein [Stanieria cyanosphaera PCC 7437]|uniref:FecR family protein n=1 Tax=Stanieria cyanosphaera (strain ATCC 29371 / PCC 7437) TaxID=111780 RepID=K9XXS4_STAC7|nr:FecR family protein [Stanieria cyanosphaera]AFZ36859.1 FecR family protein [Stanieria cyanosphaera PCC 7437]